jgi:hypothetical protein
MDDKHEDQKAEIEAIIDRLMAATPEQIEAIGKERIQVPNEDWMQAYAAALEASWGERGVGMLYGARDAILAVLNRDRITPDQFDALYGPWKRAIDVA